MISLLLKTLRLRAFSSHKYIPISLGLNINNGQHQSLKSETYSNQRGIIRTFAGRDDYSFIDEDAKMDMDQRIAEAIATEKSFKSKQPLFKKNSQPNNNKFNSLKKKTSSSSNVKRDYKIAVKKGTCVGCGALLQHEDETKPGYMPEAVLNRLFNNKEENQDEYNNDPMKLLKEFEQVNNQDDNKDEDLFEFINGMKIKNKEEEDDGIVHYKKKYDEVSDEVKDILLKHAIDNDDDENNDDFDAKDMISEEELKRLEKQEKLKNEIPTCQRCHRLRNYGVVEDDLRPGWSKYSDLHPDHFVELLSGIKTSKCVVLTLIDVFDFHGSILPHLKDIIGNNPLHIAVNKVDLLPVGFNPDRVKQWVFQEARQHSGLDRLRLSDIHLISAKSGEGIGQLLDATRGHAMARKGDIYVVGAANVGKSSLLNRLAKFDGGQSWGGGQGGKKLKKNKKKQLEGAPGGELVVRKKGITTSSFPGTTLDLIKMNIGSGVHLVDTPGLILQHQLTTRLEPVELKAVVPLKQVDHVTLRVSEGKSIMLGGLARIEFLEGRPFFITLFVNHDVKIHPCSDQGDEADLFVKKHIGELLTPPFSDNRDFGPMVTHDFVVEGDGWIQAGCDVVISGLGWFSVTGVGSCALRVVAPEGIMVVKREPLMPFEAKDTMAKGTGGKIFKKVFKKKTRPR